MTRTLALALVPWLLLAGCGHGSTGGAGGEGSEGGEATRTEPETAAAPRAAPGPTPEDDPEVVRLLGQMNEFCAGHDDCDAHERPDAYPGRVSAGETNGFISSHREQLAALGVVAVWDPGRMRFMSRVDQDVSLIIGGMFSPDHLGPDVHAAIRDRALAEPERYIAALLRAVGDDPDAGWLSSMHVPYLLTLVQERAPGAAAEAARTLLPRFEAALTASDPPPADDPDRATRLRERIGSLRTLADGS